MGPRSVMMRSSSHGVRLSLVITYFAMQQVPLLSASHGPTAGSLRLGNQPGAPMFWKVMVPPSDVASRAVLSNVTPAVLPLAGFCGTAVPRLGSGVFMLFESLQPGRRLVINAAMHMTERQVRIISLLLVRTGK